MSISKVAFIGLGNMGRPMAHNLLKAEFTVHAFDLASDIVEALAAEGAQGFSSAQEAIADVDAVVTMLPAGKHVEDLLSGSGNLLEHAKPNTLFIDCSTIDTPTAIKVAQAAQAKNLPMLDAPVSGGTGGAANGTLTFMVGGDSKALESARPLFQAMGKNIFHAGDNGAGQTAKTCNNMLLAIQMIGTCEALQLGLDNGLNPEVLSEIMQKSSGGNWTLNCYNPYPGVMEGVPSSNDYQGGFMVDLMLKDLTLSQDVAQATGTKTQFGAMARELYEKQSQSGSGNLDFSSIIKLIGEK